MRRARRHGARRGRQGLADDLSAEDAGPDDVAAFALEAVFVQGRQVEQGEQGGGEGAYHSLRVGAAFGPGRVEEAGHVAAAGKGAAVGVQDQHRRVAVAHPGELLADRVQQLRHQGVVAFRAVQGEPGDAVLDVQGGGMEGGGVHEAFSLPSRVRPLRNRSAMVSTSSSNGTSRSQSA